jgi:hypothetical protein
MSIKRRSVLLVAGHWLLLCVGVLAISGCGDEGVTSDTVRKAIPLAELPELVLKAAQKRMPDVKFTDAFQNLQKGVTLQSYEIKGRNASGKIREVRVSLTGEILEEE